MTTTNDNFIMLPTVDFCFKELMRNPKVRQGFIAAVLEKDPKEIEETILLPTILLGDYPEGKPCILDVRVRLVDGTQLDIEMQVAPFDHWEKRVIFYLIRMYNEQLDKGEPYEKLQKCIHVSILNFNHFSEDNECYRSIALCDKKSGKLYTDLLEIHILELKKLPKETPVGNNVLEWMRFFNGKTKEDFETMAENNEYMYEAYEELKRLSADERKRLEYETREKALRDWNSQMKSSLDRGIAQGIEQGIDLGREQGIAQGIELGREQGIAQGIEQGLEQGISRTKRVFRLHMQGASVDTIAEECRLSIEEVQNILF